MNNRLTWLIKYFHILREEIHLFSVYTHLLMFSSRLMSNDHHIYVSSLDLSPELQTHEFISTWLAIRYLKLNMSKTELRVFPPVLFENGNDNASLPVNWALTSEIILGLSLSFTFYIWSVNKSYSLISKTHPHLTTACRLHCCSLGTSVCC